MTTAKPEGDAVEAGSARSRWSRSRVAFAVFLAAMAVYLPTATYDAIQITDTRAAAMAAWSLGERGTWALPDEWQDVPWRSVTPDGDQITNRFPGAIVWAAPFYALWPGDEDPQKAHDVPFAPAGLAVVVASAFAMAVMFLVLDGVVSRRVALGAVLLLGLGTGTWTVSADSLFTHGPAQLAIALGLLALRADRRLLAGVAMGAAMTVRPQLGVVALVIGVGLTVSRRSLWPTVHVGAGSSLGLAVLVAHARALFGRWTPIAGYEGSRLDLVGGVGAAGGGGGTPNILENVLLTLGHPHRGILLYSPFLLVLLPGMRAGWKAASDWIRWAAIAGGIVMMVQLLSNPGAFHGGDDFFGYRLPLEMLTLATPLLALAADRWVMPRWLATRALAVTGVGAVVAFAFGATVADPRLPQVEGFEQMLEELGPHGEGYDTEGAVGYDASQQ